MIYVGTSVALATLFGEDRRPPDEFWSAMIHPCRLLQYETWAKANAQSIGIDTIAHGRTRLLVAISLAPRTQDT